MKNILILYAIYEEIPRKTIIDSLFCFSRYDTNNHYYFLNIYDEAALDALNTNLYGNIQISAIIIHYCAISMRYDPTWWGNNLERLLKLMRRFSCPKIIIPQDEYNYTGVLNNFIRDAGINRIYTCALPRDYIKLYPKSLGYEKISTVFTGYVDENTLLLIEECKKVGIKRSIDIGYRARKLPYYLGKHGQLKYILAEEFKNYLENHDSSLVYDIENTNTGNQNQNVFLGFDWIKYLLSCRTMLGCLGGSGLVDWDGSLIKKVNAFCSMYPHASFEEVEKACFPGQDNWIQLFALSPRHFECAMTHTTQLLVEGDYLGVFEADVDYIEIKKDFSNLNEVIEKVKDVEFCKSIARNCYEHVVLSQKYTYAKFVKQIISELDSISDFDSFDVKFDNLCKLSQKCTATNLGNEVISLEVYRLLGLKVAVKRLAKKIRLVLVRVSKYYIYKFLIIPRKVGKKIRLLLDI